MEAEKKSYPTTPSMAANAATQPAAPAAAKPAAPVKAKPAAPVKAKPAAPVKAKPAPNKAAIDNHLAALKKRLSI